MKKGFYRKSSATVRFTAWVVIYAFLMLPSGVAFANPPALSTVKIPSPPNLDDFVKDKKAAIMLGKALFWDSRWAATAVRPVPVATTWRALTPMM